MIRLVDPPCRDPGPHARPYEPVAGADNREFVPSEGYIRAQQDELSDLCDPTLWDQEAESTKAAIHKKMDHIEIVRLLWGLYHTPKLVAGGQNAVAEIRDQNVDGK